MGFVTFTMIYCKCLCVAPAELFYFNQFLFLQVVRCGFMGDRYFSRAAIPGHVQRAGTALRHGGRTAG